MSGSERVSASEFTGHALAALSCVAALGATSCATTSMVRVAPLETKYPVSASMKYVDANGEIVDESAYQVVRSFSFSRTVEIPIHTQSTVELPLQQDIDYEVKASKGEAVTRFRVNAFDYDTGSHGSSAAWKIFAWVTGVAGAGVLGVTALAYNQNDQIELTGPLAAGGVFLGLSGVSFLIAAMNDSPAKWQFDVSGLIVRAKSPGLESRWSVP